MSLIKNILQHPVIDNSSIKISGWISNLRLQSNNGFIHLNDGSCFTTLQIVMDYSDKEKQECNHIFDNLVKHVSITVSGVLVPSPAKGQSIELKTSLRNIKIYGQLNIMDYPLSGKKHSFEYLRNYPHLRVRTNYTASMARIRNSCSFATHQFFNDRNFCYVHTPIITTNDCEGAGEAFTITNINLSKVPTKKDKDGNRKVLYKKDFFGERTNLTVSGQLHVESYALGLNRVYTFGPTFRAENSNTSRHLAEFWMIEPEICFIDLHQLMNLAESYVKFCIQYVMDNNKDDLLFFNQRISKGRLDIIADILSQDFKKITYTQAINLLQQDWEKNSNIYTNPEWGDDLGSDQEKYITKKLGTTFVYNYPKKIKSFYMKKNLDEDSNMTTVQAMDLLVPGIGELIGGSIREDNYDILLQSLLDKKIPQSDLQWYLDLRKFGSTPHGGFGLGFERLIMLITGITNIRDAIPFPRYPKHCIL
jgi:asparaginyl-tRNA synthetase